MAFVAAFGGAQHFLHGGDPLADLAKAVGAEAHHAPFDAHASELRDVGVSRDDVAQAIVHRQQLIDADSPGVAGFAAFFAPLGDPDLVAGQALHGEIFSDFFARLFLSFAGGTQAPDQALGQDAVDGCADQEGL